MATQTVYVDTDVVGGLADGTSRANAYSDLRTAVITEARDLVTATDNVIFACFGALDDNGDGSVTQAVVDPSDGWVTDETNNILIIGDTGGAQQWDATKYTLSHAWNYNGVLEVNVPHVHVVNVQLENTGTTSPTIFEATRTHRLQGCLLRNTSGNGYSTAIALPNNDKSILVNNLCYGASRFFDVGYPDASVEFVLCNNTVVGCTAEGIKLTGSTNCTLKNNIVTGSIGVDYNLSGSTTTNMEANLSSDASSPNAALRNATVVFVDAANDDYSLSPSDTAAKGQGVDLSADSAYAFNVDAQDEARGSVWDIGADQVTFPVPAISTDPSPIYIGQGLFMLGTENIPATTHYGGELGGEDTDAVRVGDNFLLKTNEAIDALTPNSSSDDPETLGKLVRIWHGDL